MSQSDGECESQREEVSAFHRLPSQYLQRIVSRAAANTSCLFSLQWVKLGGVLEYPRGFSHSESEEPSPENGYQNKIRIIEEKLTVTMMKIR